MYYKMFGIFSLLLLAVSAFSLNCCVCGKKISGKYLTSNGKVYCGQSCFNKTLPKCAKCGKVLSGRYYTSNGKNYCPDCISSTWPVCRGCGKRAQRGVVFKSTSDMFFCSECSKLPKCFSCLVPAYNGKVLSDGRHICNRCARSSVSSMKEAKRIFNKVRLTMRREMKISTLHRINLRMIDMPTMKKRSPGYSHGVELGLFIYDATIKTVIKNNGIWGESGQKKKTYIEHQSYSIYFLDKTPRRKLIEVFAHELGHDWLQEYYPKVRSLKLKEGFCELCSYLVNKAMGQKEFNRRIINNPDPIYGGGFRIMYAVYNDGGMRSVKRYLKRNSR